MSCGVCGKTQNRHLPSASVIRLSTSDKKPTLDLLRSLEAATQLLFNHIYHIRCPLKISVENVHKWFVAYSESVSWKSLNGQVNVKRQIWRALKEKGFKVGSRILFSFSWERAEKSGKGCSGWGSVIPSFPEGLGRGCCCMKIKDVCQTALLLTAGSTLQVEVSPLLSSIYSHRCA